MCIIFNYCKSISYLWLNAAQNINKEIKIKVTNLLGESSDKITITCSFSKPDNNNLILAENNVRLELIIIFKQLFITLILKKEL